MEGGRRKGEGGMRKCWGDEGGRGKGGGERGGGRSGVEEVT